MDILPEGFLGGISPAILLGDLLRDGGPPLPGADTWDTDRSSSGPPGEEVRGCVDLGRGTLGGCWSAEE